MKKLTIQDLENALQDDRHHGWGYAVRYDLSTTTQVRLNRLVVAEANALGWTYEDLFIWSDSKMGRHLVDDFSGPRRDKEDARRTVRAYVNDRYLEMLKAEGAY